MRLCVLFNDIIEILNDAANYITYGMIAVFVSIFVLKKFYSHLKRFRGSDRPKWRSILLYVNSVFDVVTDLLFALSIYSINDSKLVIYFYLGLLFTVLPFCISVFSVIYWIYKWNIMTCSVSTRITNYLQRYSFILIFFTVLGDFYTAIMLVQSKLFGSPLFAFALKKRECERLIVWKFFGVIVCENIPQLLIQVSFSFDSNNKNGISLIVVLSIFCTIVSLTSSIIYFFTQFMQLYCVKKYNSKVDATGIFECKLLLHCNKFQIQHFSINRILANEILTALNEHSKNSNLWNDRNDIDLTCDVYYIRGSGILSKHEISCYFELTLTSYSAVDSFDETCNILKKNDWRIGKCKWFVIETVY